MPQQYRQGDVFLVRVESLPKNVTKTKRDNGRVILAYGERTGHAHALVEKDVTLYQTEDKSRFLEIRKNAANLSHEEHATITLEPGVYEVVQQREYSPEAIRNVAD